MAGQLERLNLAVSRISRVVKVNELVRQGTIKNDLETTLTLARILGLNGDQIKLLCDVICSDSIGNGIRMAVIKCLIPSHSVPCDAVLSLFGWMNSAEASTNIQALLLRWTTAVYEMIDDVRLLHCVYPMLFYCMKSDDLRKHACPLLVFLTKREDVLSFRVQRLLKIHSITGNDPHLNDILSLYKFYCPHLVPIRLRTSIKKPSAISFQQWTRYMAEIQQRKAVERQKGSLIYMNCRAFWRNEDTVDLPGPPVSRKAKHSDYLPAMMENMGIDDEKELLPVRCITSFDELLESIDRIQLPLQTLIALRYPVVHSLISVLRDKEYLIRFEHNLNLVFSNDFCTESMVGEVKAERMILAKLILLSQYLKEGIPAVDNFITCYLNMIWNGRDFADHIFKLITWTRMKSFEGSKLLPLNASLDKCFEDYLDLHQLLQPLKKLYFNYSVKYKVVLINCLCQLLDNYLHIDLERHKKFKQSSQTFLVSTDALQYLYLFVEDQDHYSPYDTIVHLMVFINDLITIGLSIEDGDTLLLHSAAAFYRMVVDFSLENDFPYFQLPSAIFVYAAFTSLDVAVVIQLLSIIVKCRDAIYKYRRRVSESSRLAERKAWEQPVKTLNVYVSDLMNCLWIHRAFVHSHPLSVFNMPQQTTKQLFVQNFGTSFSIYLHPALLPFNFTFQKTVSPLPDVKTPVSQANVEGSALFNYFSFLNDIGLDALHIFITSLAKA